VPIALPALLPLPTLTHLGQGRAQVANVSSGAHPARGTRHRLELGRGEQQELVRRAGGAPHTDANLRSGASAHAADATVRDEHTVAYLRERSHDSLRPPRSTGAALEPGQAALDVPSMRLVIDAPVTMLADPRPTNATRLSSSGVNPISAKIDSTIPPTPTRMWDAIAKAATL